MRIAILLLLLFQMPIGHETPINTLEPCIECMAPNRDTGRVVERYTQET